jgi:hypothetical protein
MELQHPYRVLPRCDSYTLLLESRVHPIVRAGAITLDQKNGLAIANVKMLFIRFACQDLRIADPGNNAVM